MVNVSHQDGASAFFRALVTMSAAMADVIRSASAVNEAAIVVLIFMSSPARAVSGQNAVVMAIAPPSDPAHTQPAKPLPGIFNVIDEYREHKESTSAALVC